MRALSTSRARWLLPAAFGLLLFVFGLMAAGAGAARADAGNNGTPAVIHPTTALSAQSPQDDGAATQCGQGDNPCDQINWCDSKDSADAPTVMGGGGQKPPCLKPPVVNAAVCCKAGSGSFDATATNPAANNRKLRVGFWVDSGTVVAKWVAPGETANFHLGGLANGVHTAYGGVWSKGHGWIVFGKGAFTIMCASPSTSTSVTASHTRSSSPSPSRSYARSHTPVPVGYDLPTTGAPVGWIAGTAVALVVAGVVLLLAARRRRTG